MSLLTPICLNSYKGIGEEDGVIFANFRADRMRQIISALCEEDFNYFTREKFIAIKSKLGMVEYSKQISEYLPILFPKEKISNSLPEVIAKNDKRQLHIAETEKYAHVTFFFAGGREDKFDNEDRVFNSLTKS